MSTKTSALSASTYTQGMKKIFLSFLLVFTFAVYALHERLSDPGTITAAQPARTNGSSANRSSASSAVQNVSSASKQGLYNDGAYTGDVTDAYYGMVQVKAVIQGGKITDVQFLDYPHDRRTSQRINEIAMPYLKTEAIQAQNANVNIISGATLTSEAFMQSLQSALSSAKS